MCIFLAMISFRMEMGPLNSQEKSFGIHFMQG